MTRAFLLLLTWLPLVASSPAARVDAGDDDYRFLVGLVDKGLYERAVQEARDFLRQYPRHAKAELATYRLATALFELDRREEARPYYARLGAREGFEYRAEALFRAGQCALDAEQDEEARRAFEGVLALDQDYLFGPATFFLGEAHFRAGRYDAAEESYARLLREHADSEYARDAERALAWCAWETDRAEEAVRRIRGFLGKHESEDDPELRVLLGEALLELGRTEQARAAYGAVKSGPFRDAALRGVAFALAAGGDEAGAAQAFVALLEAYPEGRYAAEARLQAGIHFLRGGDAGRAASLLADARDPEGLYWLAEAQEARGRGDAALRTLERALDLRPEAALAARLHVARGELLTSLGRTDEAVRAFERAGSDYALYAAAVAGLNEGDTTEAIRLGTRLLREHEDSEYARETRLVLGEALFQLERYADAEKAFLPLAAATEPELGARALSRLGWCRYLSGDPDGAAQRFGELLLRFPDAEESEEGLFLLGRARAEAGDGAAAGRAWRRYLERFADGPHAAETLLALADVSPEEDARRALERLVAEHAESPLVPRALLALADRLSAAGSNAAAIGRYRALLARDDARELGDTARYGLAWCLFEAEQFEEAGLTLEEVRMRGLEPEFAASVCELAVWCWSRADDAARATAAWRRFASVAPDDERRFQAARAVVEACKRADRRRDARRVLDELLASVRDRAVATGTLLEAAYLSLEEEDLDRARRELDLARKNGGADPRVDEASFYLGEALFAQGRDEEAAAAYRAAVEHPEVGARALYKLGFAELRRSADERAEVAFAQLVATHPESELVGEGLFLLGEARFRQGAWKRAAEALTRVRDEFPRHEVQPKALFRLGVALAHLERWAEAEGALTRLAQRYPEFPNRTEAELWRGRALAAQGKTRAARQALERVIASDEGELAAGARLALGGMYEAQGQVEDALSEYLKVAVLYAHDELVAEALFRAGGCLERQGEPDQALKQYREVVSEHPDSRFTDRARARITELARR